MPYSAGSNPAVDTMQMIKMPKRPQRKPRKPWREMHLSEVPLMWYLSIFTVVAIAVGLLIVSTGGDEGTRVHPTSGRECTARTCYEQVDLFGHECIEDVESDSFICFPDAPE